mmetsp:Transcript_23422/g.34161  ORF Transcript_23422/g.34161 Transcript_23422/m.34161 type:complete len:181 (-) Transcript_23422:389-931(-)|eukprot:CAMPEP_0195527850 /NCGR_PEP_ID=MMETSP0794_2-20130614/29759_1 /TAXON_ID=515487 /ORGANISM="Stephanopyxis turris, Strain CCMP 815" /LENGTH=180 /DNA_ID=CAMNT_0040658857 /DNA_START=64 /DNA_END=606 /DNA_ORIENTATION=-
MAPSATTVSILFSVLASGSAFQITLPSSTNSLSSNASRSAPLFAGGGWGKRIKEYSTDEFANDGTGGARRGFDAYELQERSDFLRRVKNDQKNFMKKKDDEFMAIARMAGVTDQSGDGVEPMGQFDFDDEDFDIDVSVQWDDNNESKQPRYYADEQEFDPDSSITRMDTDGDVAGALGQW